MKLRIATVNPPELMCLSILGPKGAHSISGRTCLEEYDDNGDPTGIAYCNEECARQGAIEDEAFAKAKARRLR